MAIVNNQPSLQPNDYPEFDSTVGNSFASSFPDAQETDLKQLQQAEAVAGGLYKIYESVVEDAASGAPMSARDSALVANTVANMTATIGVESHVRPIVTLESLYDQRIGYQITQESLLQTIKDAFAKLYTFLAKIAKRAVQFVQDLIQKMRDKGRAVTRLLETIDRKTAIGMRVDYTASFAGLLVDNQIPGAPVATYLDTITFVHEIYRNLSALTRYAVERMKAVMSLKPNALPTREALFGDLYRGLPSLDAAGLSNQSRTQDAKVSWTKPLSGNTVGIRLQPQSVEDVDRHNYGIMLVPLSEAKDYGVTTNYSTSDAYKDEQVVIQLREMFGAVPKVVAAWVMGGESCQEITQNIDTLTDLCEKFPAFLSNTVFNGKQDTTPGAVTQADLLAYCQYLNRLVTSAEQSLRETASLQTRSANAIESLLKAYHVDTDQINETADMVRAHQGRTNNG